MVSVLSKKHESTGSDNIVSESSYLEHVCQYCTPHAADGARDAGA